MMKNEKGLLNMRLSQVCAYVLILLVLALESCLFFLSVVPDGFFRFCNYHIKYLTSLLALVGMLVFLCSRDMGRRRYMFAMPLLAFVLMCLALVFASTIYYNESFLSVIQVAAPCLCIPLLYFSLHETVVNQSMYKFLVNATIMFGFIYATVALLQSIGLPLMKNDINGVDVVSLRSGRDRIIWTGDFVAFGAVLALGRAYSTRKRRALCLIAFFVMVFELFWVAQTRFLLIALVFTAAFGFVIKGKSRTMKVIFVVAAAVLIAFLFSDDLMAVLFPSELDLSSDLRLGAYPYYWSHALDMGLFGLGYIPDGSLHSYLLSMVYTAGSLRGAITDIGIVGYIARYGISGAVILALGIGCFIKGYHDRDKMTFSLGQNVEAWMALAFFIATSPTMAITDPQRIVYLPMLALLLEHALTYAPPCLQHCRM